MQTQIAKLGSRQIFLLVLAVVFSRILGPNVGPLSLFFITIFLLASYKKTDFGVFKFSVFSALAIGLSPIYLVFRGLITAEALSAFDFQIYMMFFFFVVRTFQLKSIKNNLKSIHVNEVLAIFASMTGLLIALGFQIILYGRSLGDSTAWVASGDSKNHFVNSYLINTVGSLKVETFLVQPSSTPSFLSLFLSQIPSELNSISMHLPTLLNAYAFVWVTLLGVLGVAFSATVTILWKCLDASPKPPPFALVSIASLTPLLSYILGPTLVDGFFTAIFGILMIVVMINWALRIFLKKTNTYLEIALGTILFFCSLFAWSFIGFFTIFIFVIASRQVLLSRGLSPALVNPTIILLGVFLLATIHFSNVGQDLIRRAKSVLTATGAINATSPHFLYATFAFLIIFALSSSINSKINTLLIYCAISGAISLHTFKAFSNLRFQDWNYYLLKFQWILFAGFSSIIVSLALIYSYNSNKNFKFSKLATISLAFTTLYLISESIVSTNRAMPKILRGWENPRAIVMNKVFEQNIDRKNPTMFFHYGYGGDARLANFWLTAFSDPVDPIRGWNYTIDPTGDVKQLCEVNAYYPVVSVVTSDLKLEELLDEACPQEDFIIKLVPPII